MPPFPVEDDLALFNEVQNKEIENFLLQSEIDFDDILTTKLISVSIRGESSDLLDDEGDKNDYNWLLSPPETPLFCSLDDEAPILKSKHSSHSSPASFSRKPAKRLSRSAPKRSFGLVRQMDRKGPQRMFRPLLSSVQSSTFHAEDACPRNTKRESMNVNKSQHLNGVEEHIVEDGSCTASSISYDDFSYVSNTTASIEAASTCVNIKTSNVLLGTQANEETLHAQSETFVIEEDDGPLGSCADRVDIPEVLHTSSLDAISEMVTEDADVISSYSHSDVDSAESKCCMDENEMQHDEEDIPKSVEEFDAPRTECQEESGILLADTAEKEKEESRSLALEEAMDAILFCSSILHSLAYEAANTAINNENFSMEVLRPKSPFLGKPDSEGVDSMSLGTMRKRGSKTQKAQQKMLEMDSEPLPCNAETEENTKGQYVVGVPNGADSLKPPKLESKCSCVIM